MPLVILFFDISGGELMIILLVAFLVFGPSKIPEIARKIGRGMNEVRRASDEIKREISKETRKFEQEMNTGADGFQEMKKTAEDIKKDLGQVAEPLNETPIETGKAKAGEETPVDDIK
jgi:TatA/E family protein of Tat protein translocase